MNGTPPNIGSAVKKARRKLGLSLDETARLTGVSKAMLGQIERGESSPTVSTLWKISTGLRLTFSALLDSASTTYAPSSLEAMRPMREENGAMLLYNVFPFEPAAGFEIFTIKLMPGCRYHSPSHVNVAEEYIIVAEGGLELTVGRQVFVLTKGMTIKFKGDEQHAYANPYQETVVFQNIIRY
ncbi:MAG: XRE family transcriptional regulator [Candidatus Adiutrix sp.]|jgi:transcriptional regulator with XRE-family HTH domain|nr:XRE family transcriptional regulator [Candidatus Adiutrix sp.]